MPGKGRNMQTTVDFLDAVRAAYALTSDYQVAKKLGISPAQISQYRTGRHTLGDEKALQVAELLELSPDYVLACMATERAKGEKARKAWAGLAKKLAPATIAALVAGSALALGPLPFSVQDAAAAPGSVYYVNCLIALFLAWLTTRHGRCITPRPE